MAAKGYKAFSHGMICLGKQYVENTVFEEDGASACCEAGVMHYCENPLDVLDHYPLVDNECRLMEVAEVEPLADVLRKEDKCATKKLKIGHKLKLKNYIKASIEVLFGKSEIKNRKTSIRFSSSEDFVKFDSSGKYARISTSGDSMKIVSRGEKVSFASSGDQTQFASSKKDASVASSGWLARIVSSGAHIHFASSGDDLSFASSGECAFIASSGENAKFACSGDSVHFASSGDDARIFSSGESAKLSSSGNYTRLASSGKYSIVAGIGAYNVAKAALGNWIVLAEWRWDNGDYIPKYVKAAQVDGETVKADTWYSLRDGEFVEM